MNKNILEEAMKNQTSSELGFNSQYNRNKNLPIETNKDRQIFCETSLKYEVYIGGKEKKEEKNQIVYLT